ncbi:hypothetical protein ABK040_008521 [Willaertia magna]
MNRYFLVIACLQLWREVSPVDPLTTWIPLIIALLITALKSAYDDLKRHYNDYKANHKKCHIIKREYLNTVTKNNLENLPIIDIYAKDIVVGDVVVIYENEEIPCDCVQIGSSLPNGVSYLQTANLDGEIDLKDKFTPKTLNSIFCDFLIFTIPLTIRCSHPNAEMYIFDANLEIDQDIYRNVTNNNHQLLTSTQIKNTNLENVTSINVNEDDLLSGVSMNDEQEPHDKLTSTQQTLQNTLQQNTQNTLQQNSMKEENDLVSRFISLSHENLLLQSCHLKNTKYVYGIVVYTGNETKSGMNKSATPTKRAKSDKQIDYISIFVFSFQILLTILFGIISMLNIENFQRNQIWYLQLDSTQKKQWFDPWILYPLRFFLLTTYMIPISLKITIDFMKLFFSLFIEWDLNLYDSGKDLNCVVNNSDIIEDLGCVKFICTDKTGTLTENRMEFRYCSIFGNLVDCSNDLNVTQNGVTQNNLQNNLQQKESQLLFFKALSLCHTCKREENKFKSSSPDEEALVKASLQFGNVELLETTYDTYSLLLNKEIKEDFTILNVIKFTSDRKRMTIIVKPLQKNIQNEKIYIFCKGADDVMLQRTNQNDTNIEITKEHLRKFASDGLRTLVIGFKEITPEEYSIFEKELQKTNAITINRNESLQKVYDLIENNFTILGATGIEDKLQEKVPETISFLRQADIRVWMLTGDKFETAKKIGHTCQLLQNEKLIEIDGLSQESIFKSIDNALQNVIHVTSQSNHDPYSVIIKGEVLNLAFEHPLFKQLILHAISVICCRVTPKQKADIVKFVMKETKSITLAIGDGGNDVPMIQAANIGVGISGNEGLQASRSSDFSFGKFKYLLPLLFKHGHLSYYRTSLISQFSFYKNIYLAFLQVLFNVYSGMSGMSIYNEGSLALYNFVFTGIYVFTFVFENYLPVTELLQRPKLYKHSQLGKNFNLFTFLQWFSFAICHAIVTLFFTYYSYFSGPFTFPLGGYSTIDKDYLGHILYTIILLTTICVFLTTCHNYQVINITIIFLTIIGYYIYMAIYSNIMKVFGAFNILSKLPAAKITSSVFNYSMSDPVHYFIVILTVTTCWLIFAIFRYCKKLFLPNLIEKYQLAKILDKNGCNVKKMVEIGGGFYPNSNYGNDKNVSGSINGNVEMEKEVEMKSSVNLL